MTWSMTLLSVSLSLWSVTLLPPVIFSSLVMCFFSSCISSALKMFARFSVSLVNQTLGFIWSSSCNLTSWTSCNLTISLVPKVSSLLLQKEYVLGAAPVFFLLSLSFLYPFFIFWCSKFSFTLCGCYYWSLLVNLQS